MFSKNDINLYTLDQQNAAMEVESILNLPKQELNGWFYQQIKTGHHGLYLINQDHLSFQAT